MIGLSTIKGTDTWQKSVDDFLVAVRDWDGSSKENGTQYYLAKAHLLGLLISMPAHVPSVKDGRVAYDKAVSTVAPNSNRAKALVILIDWLSSPASIQAYEQKRIAWAGPLVRLLRLLDTTNPEYAGEVSELILKSRHPVASAYGFLHQFMRRNPCQKTSSVGAEAMPRK